MQSLSAVLVLLGADSDRLEESYNDDEPDLLSQVIQAEKNRRCLQKVKGEH